MRGPVRNGVLVSGHHGAHLGFWSGKEEFPVETKGNYVLHKSHKALGSISDAMMIINRDAAFDIQYRIRKAALEYSLQKEKITPKQFDLRKIKLEEGMAVYAYKRGEYDSNKFEEVTNKFDSMRRC